MFKAFKIVLGAGFALLTIAYLVQFARVLTEGRATAYGAANIAAAFVPVALSAAIAAWVFQSAFRKETGREE